MATEFVVSFAGKATYEDFCRGVLGKGLQAQLRAYLKKVYPMKACDIRSFSITTHGTPLTLSGELNMSEPKQEEPPVAEA